jgi:hypothetical protein
MQLIKPLLHTRHLDPSEIKRLVRAREMETFQLDYKAEIGHEKTAELAKDMAALANAAGGDLIIGIQENKKGSRAGSWQLIPDAELKAECQRVTQALDLLRPPDFITSILFEPVGIDPNGSVIVISVPPSPDLVGVQDGGLRARLQFPLRVETHTKYLAYEDVMKRSSASGRAMYLKILDLKRRLDRDQSIRICTPVGGIDRGQFVPIPYDGQRHGSLQDVGIGSLRVSMRQFPAARINKLVGASTVNFGINAIQEGQELDLPYELLSAVWLEESGGRNWLCVAVDRFFVVWNGESWGLGML